MAMRMPWFPKPDQSKTLLDARPSTLSIRTSDAPWVPPLDSYLVDTISRLRCRKSISCLLERSVAVIDRIETSPLSLLRVLSGMSSLRFGLSLPALQPGVKSGHACYACCGCAMLVTWQKVRHGLYGHCSGSCLGFPPPRRWPRPGPSRSERGGVFTAANVGPFLVSYNLVAADSVGRGRVISCRVHRWEEPLTEYSFRLLVLEDPCRDASTRTLS